MIKLVLSHPWNGHEPGDLIEEEESLARRLVVAGVAREPDEGESTQPVATDTEGEVPPAS